MPRVPAVSSTAAAAPTRRELPRLAQVSNLSLTASSLTSAASRWNPTRFVALLRRPPNQGAVLISGTPPRAYP